MTSPNDLVLMTMNASGGSLKRLSAKGNTDSQIFDWGPKLGSLGHVVEIG